MMFLHQCWICKLNNQIFSHQMQKQKFKIQKWLKKFKILAICVQTNILDLKRKSLIRYTTHYQYFEKLCEELPAGMDQYKCPQCSHLCKYVRFVNPTTPKCLFDVVCNSMKYQHKVSMCIAKFSCKTKLRCFMISNEWVKFLYSIIEIPHEHDVRRWSCASTIN